MLTALYLTLLPTRPMGLDVGLAVLALAGVGLTARETRERFWGRPSAPAAARLRHSAFHILGGSAAVALLFAGWRMAVGSAEAGVLGDLFRPTLLAALVLFLPWAAAQQTLFQFYLLGRLRALWPGAPPAALAALNGLFFGLVHVPEWDLALATVAAGAVWSWYYLHDRSLSPLVLSHAGLGATYFHWVRGRDLGLQWLGALGL
jgi:membrane protease YdiL (CAAX protease family)